MPLQEAARKSHWQNFSARGEPSYLFIGQQFVQSVEIPATDRCMAFSAEAATIRCGCAPADRQATPSSHVAGATFIHQHDVMPNEPPRRPVGSPNGVFLEELPSNIRQSLCRSLMVFNVVEAEC